MEHDGITGAANPLISRVSDTAKWVALHRAMESKGKDALIHDPYDRSLAGMQGENIAAGLRYGKSSAWTTIVRTAVYDVLGREVETLVNSYQNSGVYSVQFNGANLASGVYFYRLTVPGESRVAKMILMK